MGLQGLIRCIWFGMYILAPVIAFFLPTGVSTCDRAGIAFNASCICWLLCGSHSNHLSVHFVSIHLLHSVRTCQTEQQIFRSFFSGAIRSIEVIRSTSFGYSARPPFVGSEVCSANRLTFVESGLLTLFAQTSPFYFSWVHVRESCFLLILLPNPSAPVQMN